jgi:hypothetical protein
MTDQREDSPEARIAAVMTDWEFCPCGFSPMNGHQLRQHRYHCPASPTRGIVPCHIRERMAGIPEIFSALPQRI